MDAICYALFGKPFRRINKPQLINTINNKNMCVECEFTVNNVLYKIRRGLKPSIFEIYANDKMINQDADSRDYQAYVEQNILKIGYKTFCQVVVLGNANFTPFMLLNAAGRREIIEDLLDIQVFTKMNLILRDKVQENKQQLIDVAHQIELTQKTIELNKKHAEQTIKATQKTIDKKLKQIEQFNETNIKHQGLVTKKQEKLAKLTEAINEKTTKLRTKLEQATAMQTKYRNRINSSNKEIEFYLKNQHCPVCEQSISPAFKQQQVATRQKTLTDCTSKHDQLHTAITTINEKFDQMAPILAQQKQLTADISATQQSITVNSRMISALEHEIAQLRQTTDKIVVDNSAHDKLVELQASKDQLINQRELYTVAQMLLKDGGIKSQIIKQYIPIINKLINGYLEQMEFFCQFQLNEAFEESIKARHRDEFSYNSFSQGEKMRIDLSLLFAWRELARMRNSTACNILVLDEIMDSSLDGAGTEDFIKIVLALSKSSKIIIISHKIDQIQDKFDRSIRFNKLQNFSKLIEVE
jgi:DNA repair exonuclease SbcCD ATPase subunit